MGEAADRLRSLVANAGDREQVRKGDAIERFAHTRRLEGWRFLLSSEIGRELASSLMGATFVFEPVEADAPYIFANAALQKWGLAMRSEMLEADDAGWFLMEKEAIARNRAIGTPKQKKETEPIEEDDDA